MFPEMATDGQNNFLSNLVCNNQILYNDWGHFPEEVLGLAIRKEDKSWLVLMLSLCVSALLLNR